MRTPADIKKGLRLCRSTESCDNCPYDCTDGECTYSLFSDAIGYIEVLEARLHALPEPEENPRVKFAKPNDLHGYVVARIDGQMRRLYVIGFRTDGKPLYCDCAAEEFTSYTKAQSVANRCFGSTGVEHCIIDAHEDGRIRNV